MQYMLTISSSYVSIICSLCSHNKQQVFRNLNYKIKLQVVWDNWQLTWMSISVLLSIQRRSKTIIISQWVLFLVQPKSLKKQIQLWSSRKTISRTIDSSKWKRIVSMVRSEKSPCFSTLTTNDILRSPQLKDKYSCKVTVITKKLLKSVFLNLEWLSPQTRHNSISNLRSKMAKKRLLNLRLWTSWKRWLELILNSFRNSENILLLRLHQKINTISSLRLRLKMI